MLIVSIMLGHLPDYKHTEVTEESLPQVLWSLAFHGEGAVFDKWSEYICKASHVFNMHSLEETV